MNGSEPGFSSQEVLTTLELPPDKPAPDRCGTCEHCIKACPTGRSQLRIGLMRALHFLLNNRAERSIPLEFRPLIGNRILVAMDCLDACPWNRFAQVSRETAFSARRSTAGMVAAGLFEIERFGISRAVQEFTDQTNQALRVFCAMSACPGERGRSVRSARRWNTLRPTLILWLPSMLYGRSGRFRNGAKCQRLAFVESRMMLAASHRRMS